MASQSHTEDCVSFFIPGSAVSILWRINLRGVIIEVFYYYFQIEYLHWYVCDSHEKLPQLPSPFVRSSVVYPVWGRYLVGGSLVGGEVVDVEVTSHQGRCGEEETPGPGFCCGLLQSSLL